MRKSIAGLCAALMLSAIGTPSPSAAGEGSPAAPPSSAADWPHFLGPQWDCSSPEKGLLHQWPAGGPKELWRAKLGRGWACPVVSRGELFIPWTDLENDMGGNNKETLACLDAATGKEKWRFVYESQFAYSTYGVWHLFGVKVTPTVTDKYVFTISTNGLMHCIDRKTGTKVWGLDLSAQYKPDIYGAHGWHISPVVSGDVVVVNLPSAHAGPKEPTHKCVGLDAATGKQLWLFDMPHKPNTEGATQGQSPVLADFAGEPCVVFSANRTLLALRAKDGKEVWRSEHVRAGASGASIPPPVVAGNRIFQANIFDVSYVVEVDRSKAPFATKVTPAPNVGLGISQASVFAHWDGYLYGFRYGEDPGLTGQKCTLMCVDLKTGKVMWSKDKFAYSPSVIAADGLLFVRVNNGLVLLEASPSGYVEKGRVPKLYDTLPPMMIGRMMPPEAAHDGGWTMPVLSHGLLYVRTPLELICFRVSADASSAP